MADALNVKSAAVIGAGVMGAGIAAHLANAGIPTVLLDRKSGPTPAEEAAGVRADDPRVASRIAAAGLTAALKSRPPAFMDPNDARLVRIGNIEDDLALLEEVDWVVEAVIERLDIKAELFARIAPHLHPEVVLSSNTSGLSCAALSAALPADLRSRFLVTHFFNPPRFLHLLELVSGPETDPELMAGMAAFAERSLGKGVVVAADTPNFIANRVGTFGMAVALDVLVRRDSHVAEIDALTGPLLGRPASATFRTADLVGLDTLMHVFATLRERLPDDAARALFTPPDFVTEMVERGWLGSKAGTGFYRKTKDEQGRRQILMLDPSTLDYVPQPPVAHASMATAAREPDVGARIAALTAADDRAGELAWALVGPVLHYAACCVPEISNDISAVDDAMRWGFGWELGPFELWDALGVESTARRLEADGLPRPAVVDAVLSHGGGRFHGRSSDGATVFDPGRGEQRGLISRSRVVSVAERRAAGAVVQDDADATLIDLGDGVLGCAFKTKMNTITDGIGDTLQRALQRVGGEFRGLVIGNDAPDFCAGANLHMVLDAARAGDFARIDTLVAGFQELNQGLRFAPFPVVVAARGRVLGGGCELLLAADAACAAAESYIGLVEVGAGLIPAGGGCKELLRRFDERRLPGATDGLPGLQALFELIGMGRVSGSAAGARSLGFLGDRDRVVMNVDHVLHDARALVLALDSVGYVPPRERTDLRVMGATGLAALRVGLWNMAEGGHVSEYDVQVGMTLGRVLCGGEMSRPTTVSEPYLLELEREAFLHLCGQEPTQARMEHLLRTGKPLRN